MLEGRHPRTGVVLGSGRASVAAFDLTFSAPKSVSVLFALAGAEAARTVVAAHADAVAGSLSYLEQHAITATRRSGPPRRCCPPAGPSQRCSRTASAGTATRTSTATSWWRTSSTAADGRWGACDRRGIAAHRLAAAAVYEAQFRAGLATALGVRWTGGPGRTAEVAGVGPELLGAFSSRGADIRRHLDEAAVHSGRGARIAWAATRPAKAPARAVRRATRPLAASGRRRRRPPGARAGPGAGGARPCSTSTALPG